MAMESKVREPMTSEKMEAMMEKEPPRMPERTWRPIVGGLLSMVAGYVNVLAGILVAVGLSTGALTVLNLGFSTGPMAVLLIVLGAISILGGSFALARRAWPVAFIGSVVSLFPSLAIIPGTLSLLYVTLGRNEFSHQKK